ncbi:MAG: hypothetical protein M4579_000582 [Chaenotheca gracillima]|nr:MAG: hypothetical protein M4579_000582 [Chaenotheca gracillima]
MPDSSKIQEFPDINNKLAAPTKKSLFERQKAEAEARRLREEAETAAVYEDFVKSFEDNDAGGSLGGGRPGTGGGDGLEPPRNALGGPSKRHFTGPPSGPSGRQGQNIRGGVPSSGPGSLGPTPGSGSRKRAFDGSQREGPGLFAFDDTPIGTTDTKPSIKSLDDDGDQAQDERKSERAAPKPTLHLSSLPPGTSPAAIKAILPPVLNVDAVRILPPSGPGSVERRSVSCIVTLGKDTPSNDIDTVTSSLQNRYLGRGYYLSISRHLSSAALNTGSTLATGATSALTSLPFGARPARPGPGGPLNRAPPPSTRHRGGFAPPSSFSPAPLGRGGPPVQVSVNPPSDLKQLRLIHKTLELLLTHGPEFEALLMSRPDVQRGEKWAWLWNARSPGGVWYRWRLWNILSGPRAAGNRGRQSGPIAQDVFDGGAVWMAPEKGLRFEYTTQVEDFVSDSDYNSSEDDDSGDEDHRHNSGHGGRPPVDILSNEANPDGKAYLNPLQRSKLTHLLARMPTSNGKLRKGDVARITAFAIEHAGEGAEEVVDMIVANVQQPLSFTAANPTWKAEHEMLRAKAEEGTTEEKERSKERQDSSPSKLIALYIISDILSSSSTSGVRHAWRYRQLFETTLKRQKTFENLGRLDKDMHWGRLKAEKWRRSVGVVLTLWEGWCVFPQAAQEHFASVFANPPPTAAEQAALAAAASSADASNTAKSRWKTVDVTAQASESPRPPILKASPGAEDDVDGDEMDVDGEPMLSDEDIDGVPMEEDVEDDYNGEVRDDEEMTTIQTVSGASEAAPMPEISGEDARQATTVNESKATQEQEREASKEPMRRRRPKAEDMFADSDED